MANADAGRQADKRPLSPHLTIYKPMLTMAMSMAHRITGAALYLSVALLALYLLGLGLGPSAFAAVSWIASGFFGYLVLFLFSWAALHHLLGGLRHEVWDRGLYMDPKGRELMVQATLGGGIVLTLLLWIASAIAG
jgi:succinate dehydrogenase / fumarate reductase cytochrome b subunit